MKFRALIWDCDGCLLDSEYIACALGAKLATEAGCPISTEDYIRRFCGQSKSHTLATLRQESGIDIKSYLDRVDKKKLQREAFQSNLKPISGIPEILDDILLPMAIASGSEYDRLEFTLKLTGLYNRFSDCLYSASLVERGKPHPDIFLYTAEKLGVSPHDCLVIEDSQNGVRAGKAAGMTVFGFCGASHILDKDSHAQELQDLGADLVFHDMWELPRLIQNFFPK